ncbi:purple acid phosphatase family protein [Sphingomonas mucosissima]|uniref:Alkaline phosphatase n=1 Tax=Sphingomonas mucosissima TaxID=370959 RepID=A0A245ZJJ8_9SPHN|nr:metallophosphoesterase family protein [Sphingomonas mucosissima]OWK29921.1 alkaline phosphatase precursor [Sphingomonas mucosissima]
MRKAFLLGAALVAAPAIGQTRAGNQLAPKSQAAMPRTPGIPYRPTGIPDRIVLTPAADASRGAAVAWRTDPRQTQAVAEIGVALDSPGTARDKRQVSGTSFPLDAVNGPSIYHQVRFAGLQPGTAYVYRVKGADGWSEWLPFHTPAASPAPFTFLYFGDTQNRILEVASRVIRQAFRSTADPALVVHAGDLVAQREEKAHDDEWGEWAAAGGYNYATIQQLPATGNHEYVDVPGPAGQENRLIGPHWQPSFTLPRNGAPGAEATSYFVDWQGVRFIVLDGTSALDLGTLASQTRWLDATLAASKARWNVVLFHQPIFTCARPNDTEELKAAWKPIFEARGVDLVLQGHDHCYSRLTSEQGRDASNRARAAGRVQGPVYLVSVVGSKMYALNDRAATQPDRVAEDTELYQRIDVDGDRLTLRSFTATGRLYDGFRLNKRRDGRNRLEVLSDRPIDTRRCAGNVGPDGFPCTARGR